VKSALLDPNSLIKDEYWNLVTQARDKREGPDGIAIWNTVNKQLKNNKVAPSYAYKNLPK